MSLEPDQRRRERRMFLLTTVLFCLAVVGLVAVWLGSMRP